MNDILHFILFLNKLIVTCSGILRSDEGTEVAVKMYHPDIKAIDIQKEIDAMTQLKHDFIIPLKGAAVSKLSEIVQGVFYSTYNATEACSIRRFIIPRL